MATLLGFLILLIVKYVAVDGGIQDDITADFSVKIYHHLRSIQKDENIFYSPFSIVIALGMIELGAAGTTLEQIQHVMGSNSMQRDEEFDFFQDLSQSMKADHQQYVMEVANSLFVREGFQLSDNYLQMLKRYFGASVENVDFNHPSSVADLINEWVQNQTDSKIQSLLSEEDFSALAHVVLVNAIYFKGNWKSPFRAEHTHTFPFTKDDESEIQIPMMHQQGDFFYGEFSDGSNEAGGVYQVLEMPYLGDKLSMMIVLPRQEVQLATLEPLIKTQLINEWASYVKKQKVEVFLPRFKMMQNIDLKEVLAGLGILELFSADADLSAMTGKKELYISKAIHSSFIEVNEEGSEAAAASEMVVVSRMLTLNPQVIIDHPFFFLIRNQRTGTILFMGRVMHPEDVNPNGCDFEAL
ncbi:neuroserpin [Pristis pectinata]|uniref:neuroserpin n=1 Tax=Pristis pectinata TaxID=685728 RepID=UPI00223E81B5|nr:neuroserpin [Pristis pectinata]XP_051873162.1 neuroserpin [Pristis pectinata]